MSFVNPPVNEYPFPGQGHVQGNKKAGYNTSEEHLKTAYECEFVGYHVIDHNGASHQYADGKIE